MALTPVPVNSDIQVNPTGSLTGYDATVTALTGGGFVVAWAYSVGAAEDDIAVQVFDKNGSAVNNPRTINTYRTDYQADPTVTALTGGGFVVTWASFNQDGSAYGIYGQRYTATGAQSGGEFRINTTVANSQSGQSVAALPDGGFLVTWSSFGQDNGNSGIYGQFYNANGTPSGGEFKINTNTAANQGKTSVAALSGGGFIVTLAGGSGQFRRHLRPASRRRREPPRHLLQGRSNDGQL